MLHSCPQRFSVGDVFQRRREGGEIYEALRVHVLDMTGIIECVSQSTCVVEQLSYPINYTLPWSSMTGSKEERDGKHDHPRTHAAAHLHTP